MQGRSDSGKRKAKKRRGKEGNKNKREIERQKKALTVLLVAGAPEYAGAADDWRGRERNSHCGAGTAVAGCRARNGDGDDVCDGGAKSEAAFVAAVAAVVVDVGDINDDDDAESDVDEAGWDEDGDGGLDVDNARPAPRMDRLMRP